MTQLYRSRILGVGSYVPEQVVTNEELAKFMTTSDQWIRERSGIIERHYVQGEVGASDLGYEAAKKAITNAGLTPKDIDLIIFATLSPDHEFPGPGCFLQAKLELPGVPALDIRNQCSGFLYGLQVANSFIRAGTYQNILLVGSEVQSTGMDFSDSGRDVSVLFGDGAGAVVVGRNTRADENTGILDIIVGADGRYAKELWIEAPGSRYKPRISHESIEAGKHYPKMNGRQVFKHAVTMMPKMVNTLLDRNQMTRNQIDLLIPHQANLRISEAVQQFLELPNEKVFNNIQKYGNTTAASIPLAMDEAIQEGKLKEGDLLALCAFGSGFTWGAALIRW